MLRLLLIVSKFYYSNLTLKTAKDLLDCERVLLSRDISIGNDDDAATA